MSANNCPFYGKYLYRPPPHASTPFLLLDQRGNQCALVSEKYAPCYMEINGLAVDWRECPVMKDVEAQPV
jgi:hypothetical protein